MKILIVQNGLIAFLFWFYYIRCVCMLFTVRIWDICGIENVLFFKKYFYGRSGIDSIPTRTSLNQNFTKKQLWSSTINVPVFSYFQDYSRVFINCHRKCAWKKSFNLYATFINPFNGASRHRWSGMWFQSVSTYFLSNAFLYRLYCALKSSTTAHFFDPRLR